METCSFEKKILVGWPIIAYQVTTKQAWAIVQFVGFVTTNSACLIYYRICDFFSLWIFYNHIHWQAKFPKPFKAFLIDRHIKPHFDFLFTAKSPHLDTIKILYKSRLSKKFIHSRLDNV